MNWDGIDEDAPIRRNPEIWVPLGLVNLGLIGVLIYLGLEALVRWAN